MKTQFIFDPYSFEYERNPHPVLKIMREQYPAYWWSPGPGWIFTRYEDCVTILRDKRFSSMPSLWENYQPKEQTEKSVHEKLLDTMLFSFSKEDHARIRKLVDPVFSARSVDNMKLQIQKTVKSFLPEKVSEFDVVQDYAAKIPMAIMCDLLNVPENLTDRFYDFGAALFRGTNARMTEQQRKELSSPIAAGVQMLEELIDRRRHDMGNDIISSLINAQDQEQALSYDEMVGLIASLVAAGMDTTIQAITYAARFLIEHPDILKLVIDQPALRSNAVQEVLRYDFFARTGPSRYATVDIDLAGVTIKKGQLVFPCLTSAMRDPGFFPDPDTFDIHRNVSRSIVFGGGMYHCLGNHLAIMEAGEAIGQLFEKYPRLHIQADPTYSPEPFFRTISSLKVQVK